jgi:hypothetical protein
MSFPKTALTQRPISQKMYFNNFQILQTVSTHFDDSIPEIKSMWSLKVFLKSFFNCLIFKGVVSCVKWWVTKGLWNILRRKIPRRIFFRRKILRSKNNSPEAEDSATESFSLGKFFAGAFYARKILRRRILHSNFPRRWKILRRRILRPDDSLPENSSLGYFFARKILRRKVLRSDDSSPKNSSLQLFFVRAENFSLEKSSPGRFIASFLR